MGDISVRIIFRYDIHQETLSQVSEKLFHALSLTMGVISIRIIFGYDMGLANYLSHYHGKASLELAKHAVSAADRCRMQLCNSSGSSGYHIRLNQPVASPSYRARERVP